MLAVLIALYYTLVEGTAEVADFAIGFGIICLLSGLLDLAIGLILLIASSPVWGKAFLLSAGLLLLLSGLSCGLGASMY